MEQKSAIQPVASGSGNVNVSTNERIVSAVGGTLLLLAGLKNLKDQPTSSIMKLIGGGFMLFRGTTGFCPFSEIAGRNTANKQPAPITIKETLTVNRSRNEVYSFWRKLENLPLFMKHLKVVKQLTHKRSHWEAFVPGGMGAIQWEAEIVLEQEGERLGWKSVPGAVVDNAGEVQFKDAPGNTGTIISAIISYMPPAGDVGKLAGKLLNHTFGQIIQQDLQSFKTKLESGELPTNNATSSANPTSNLPLTT